MNARGKLNEDGRAAHRGAAMSDSQTYDTPCAVCGKVLDGHTHDPRELSAEELNFALKRPVQVEKIKQHIAALTDQVRELEFEFIRCKCCGSTLMYKRVGKDYQVLHDCLFGTRAQEVYQRAITAEAENARLNRRIMQYENDEASVCPEDVGFVEYIGVLQNRIADHATALKNALTAPAAPEPKV